MRRRAPSRANCTGRKATALTRWTGRRRSSPTPYDALNRLTGETYDSSDNTKDYAATFTFDLSGNRKQKTQTGAFQPATTTYAVNDRDQLTSEVTGAVTTNYTYDVNGSTIVKGTDSYAWDLRNRMKSATIAGVTTVYAYDASNQRVSQQTGAAAATNYVNDKSNHTGYPQVIEEKAGATPTRSYAIGSTVLGQSSGPGAVTYFLRDGHGSNRAMTSAAGVVTASFDYQAFGEAIGFDPKLSGTIHHFAGDAEYDAATGNYYHDARWRSGHLFTSFDSFEADPNRPADLHKYLYASCDPVQLIDPSAQFSFISMVTAVGLTSGLAALVTGTVNGFSTAAQGGSFWAGFGAGAISGGISTALPLVLEVYFAGRVPPAIAFGIGGFVGELVAQSIWRLVDPGRGGEGDHLRGRFDPK